MVPGGITESIWHFSGLLRVFDDIARDREVLDEGGLKSHIDDYNAKLAEVAIPPVDDIITTFPVRMPDGDFADDVGHAHVGAVRHLHDQDHHGPILPQLVPFGPIPPLQEDAGGGGGGGGDITIEVTYGPGGNQSLIEIHQVNFLVNDNILEIGSSPSPLLASMLAAESGNTLDVLGVLSDYAIPNIWQEVPQDTMALGVYVQAYDQHLLADSGMPEPHSVTPGYYTNGEIQDPSSMPPNQLTIPVSDAPPVLGYSSGLGQWAFDGGNSTVNSAEIVDLSASPRTMIVLGNYYSTDAIIQTNAYTNLDHISVNPGAIISDGGNQATNMADFIQNPGVYSGLPAYFAGPQWDVEVVNGNYYNVNMLQQVNYLSNNNITTQESSDVQSYVEAGGNQLVNQAQLNNGNFTYDLVIVGGSYNNFNAIFQTNVLVNNDIIKMSGNGLDPIQTVQAGNNQLVNMATIDNYGGNNIQPVGSDLTSLIDAIKNQAATLDPAFGQMVAGDGGVFHVLYVTGNYYDINALWQTNVVANSNVAMQVLNPASGAVEAYYGNGPETQSISTGNNVLVNDASIVQANPTISNVAGQVYTDTILIQANLVTQQSDHVNVANPQTLVPEIVAFIGNADMPSQTQTQTATPSSTQVQEDPLVSLTH